MTDFETIFAKYMNRDHWGHYGPYGVITMKVQALKQALDRGQDIVTTEQDVVDYYNNQVRVWAEGLLAQLDSFFRGCNYYELEQIVRYNQPFTLELCELITGERFKGKSNKAIRLVLSELCNREVQP